VNVNKKLGKNLIYSQIFCNFVSVVQAPQRHAHGNKKCECE